MIYKIDHYYSLNHDENFTKSIFKGGIISFGKV